LLTELRLWDYQGWEGGQAVRLAPLTLFYGWNGTGKTALIQSMCHKGAGPKPRMLQRRLRRGDRELESLLGRWLTTMGIVDDFSVAESEFDAGSFGLRVKVRGTEAYVPVHQAGAGAQRALLVLVRVFCRMTRAPIHLDYPETYLQPLAESVLGDALLAAVKRRGTQLLVETHSERLLRRIQRRIAEGKITNDDVAVYFVDDCDGRPGLYELVIDEYGSIAHWPRDFFGEEMSDIVAMTQAAERRRSRKQANSEASAALPLT
jgi:predicted ATPase